MSYRLLLIVARRLNEAVASCRAAREINLTMSENEKAKLRHQVSYLFRIVDTIAELVIMIMKRYVFRLASDGEDY